VSSSCSPSAFYFELIASVARVSLGQEGVVILDVT
jgi:hypothetical protein